MKKLHRFIVEADLASDKINLSEREVVRQMYSILKLKTGESVILSNGNQDEAECRILVIGSRAIELEVIRRMKNASEPKRHVTLYCTILKGDHFDLMVQKAVEVGVAAIVPVISKRTVKLDVNTSRLATIAQEAAEQAGRGIVPPISEPVKFDQALREASAANSANYFMDVDAPLFDKGVLTLRDMDRVGIFIGPEGGWDESETAAAATQGCIPVSLGPLVLRAETAAIVSCYLAASNMHVHGPH